MSIRRIMVCCSSGGGAGDTVNKITIGASEAQSVMGVTESIVYEWNVNFADAPGIAGQIDARLSAIVRTTAGTGTYKLYTGATAPGSTAGATLRDTITTVSATDEQKTALSAAFVSSGVQTLVQITAVNSGAGGISHIRGVEVALG